MQRCGTGLIGLLLPCAALAQTPSASPPSAASLPSETAHPAAAVHPALLPPIALHTSYDTYAAGIHVATVDTGFSFGPWNYQMNMAWHTTGMVGLLFRGHQFDHVNGSWHGTDAAPSEFVGQGEWRGQQRLAEIGYQRGMPVIHQLEPPNVKEREQVPDSLQFDTIDTLSALAQLLHIVAETGRCDTMAHTYDGRRAVEIEAHTVGEETLEATNRSSFSGKALRCGFSGRLLAGFKFDDDRTRDSKPMHGSAWLAPVVAGGPPLPVRMAFETRWFGDAVMYLTGTGPGADLKVAVGN